MQYFSPNVNVREQPEITNQDICVLKKKKKERNLKKGNKKKESRGSASHPGILAGKWKTPDIFVLHILEHYN